MNSLRNNKIATTLSLFALLLIFIAPIVSQALMRHDYTPAAHTQHHHSHGKPEAQTPLSSSITFEHDACGYCALVAHCPVLSAENIALFALRFIPREHAEGQRPWRRIITAHYRPQSPRAPPTVI